MPYFQHPKLDAGIVEWDDNRGSFVDPRGYVWLPDEMEMWAYERGFELVGPSIPPLKPEDFEDVNVNSLSKRQMDGYLSLIGANTYDVYSKRDHRKRLEQLLEEGW